MEAFVIARHVAVGDPLALPAWEFDQYLRLISRGELVRSGASGDPCRAFVEDWLHRS